jgi:hypothetical protein
LVGQLCYLVAFFSVLGMIEFALFAIGIIPRDDLKDLLPTPLLDLFFWAGTGGFAINTLVQVVLGNGLIRLQPWARWIVIVLTAFSLAFSLMSSLILCVSGSAFEAFEPLLGFSIDGRIWGLVSLIVGGLVHLMILWPLVSPGSTVVFSQAYREVIRQTPELRSRMHWLLKTLIGVILGLVVGFVAYLLAIYFRLID